jgi:hypothetical protein
MTTLFGAQNGWANTSHTTSLAAPASESQLAAVLRITGPLRQSINLTGANAGDAQALEMLTLSQITRDTYQSLGALVPTIMQSANPGIIELAPLQRAESDKFMLTAYHFHRQFAAQTPAGAPPNYLEVSQVRSEAELTRHALGMRCTAQELRSGIGQFFLRQKTRMLVIGFVEMLELKFFQAVVESPSLFARAAYMRATRASDLARLGRIHNEQWDIMHRHGNSIYLLIDMATREFSSRKLRPTHAVARAGLRSLWASSKERTQFRLYGPGASNNAEMLGSSIGTQLADVKLITINGYDYTESNDIVINPLDRDVAVGSHYRMGVWNQACDMSDYCSAMAETEITSVNDNAWVYISTPQALRACGRFTADGKLHPFHDTLAKTISQRRSVPIVGTEYDMFLYTTQNRLGESVINRTAVLGNMEEWAWPEAAVERSATALEHWLRRDHNMIASDFEAITDGLADIAAIYDLEWLDAGISFAKAAFLQSETEPKLPEARAAGAGAGQWALPATVLQPYGFGSAAGYRAIARANGRSDIGWLPAGMVGRAVAFFAALRKLHTLMRTVFDWKTHPALDPRLVPAFARRAGTGDSVDAENSLLNFAQNIVDQNKLPLGLFAGAVPNGQEAPAKKIATFPVVVAAVPSVASTPITESIFGTQTRKDEFVDAFNASEFGKQYRRYVGPQKDGDPPLFVQFLRESLKNPTAGQPDYVVGDPEASRAALALVYAANNFVKNGQKLRKVGADELNALKSAAVPEEDAQTPASVDRQIKATWLVSPFSKLTGAVAATFGLLSPFEPNKVVDPAQFVAQRNLLDTSGRNDKLARLTVFSAASPSAGVREQREQRDARAGDGFDGTMPLPSFAQVEFFEIVGAQLVQSEQLVKRFRKFGALGDTAWLKRVCAQMLLLAPVLEDTMLRLYKCDVPLPIEFLLEQFLQRYRTTSVVFFAHNPAEPSFQSWFYDPDMHSGRDMIQKILAWHMSMYLGVTCRDPQRHIEMRDVCVIGYHGGHNAAFFDQDQWHPKQLTELDYDGPSVLCYAVPCGTLFKAAGADLVPLTHDIRGFTAAIGRGAHAQRAPDFKSALYYYNKLSLGMLTVASTEAHWNSFHPASDVINTTTHQGAQRFLGADRRFSVMVHSHDVWEQDAGPGVLQRREKLSTTMAPERPVDPHAYSPV